MSNKGYASKSEAFAEGGAVLGRTDDWWKDSNRFTGKKPPAEPERFDNFEKGAVKGQVKAPPAKGKSLKAVKPHA